MPPAATDQRAEFAADPSHQGGSQGFPALKHGGQVAVSSVICLYCPLAAAAS